LPVDGNFALIRSEVVAFKAQKSSKSWISTAVSGEGLLQTFEGQGYVRIAPTQGVYDRLASAEEFRSLVLPPGSRHTETTNKKK